MKVSDYIMEQDINTTSCDDIELARCFAEMEVLGTIIDCYNKQSMIMEYYKGDDITEFSIFQEAAVDTTGDSYTYDKDATDKKKENIFQRMKNAILSFFRMVSEAFLKIIGKESFKHMAERVKDRASKGGNSSVSGDDNFYYTFPDSTYDAIISLNNNYKIISKHADMFVTYLKTNVMDINKYKDIQAEIDKIASQEKKFDGEGNTKLTADQVYKILMDLEEAKIETSVRKMLKNIDDAKKKEFKANSDGQLMKTINDLAKSISKQFTDANNSLRKLFNGVINKEHKSSNMKMSHAENKQIRSAIKNAGKNVSSGLYPDTPVNVNFADASWDDDSGNNTKKKATKSKK